MPRHSERFGFDVPDDFPIELLEAVHVKVSDGDDAIYAQRLEVWRAWAGGCNGTVYRFMGAASASDQWASTYTDHPDIDLNVRQDRLLFEFFLSALSSVECLAYGLCAIGEYLKPQAFPVTTKPQAITFGFAATTFSQEYAGDALAQQLQATHNSAEMADLRKTRNILAHRSAPGRTFSETLTVGGPAGDTATVGPTMWLSQALGSDTTERPRAWLTGTLNEILEAAKAFVHREL